MESIGEEREEGRGMDRVWMGKKARTTSVIQVPRPELVSLT